MKINRRRVLGCAGVVIATAALSACGSGGGTDGKTITVATWGGDWTDAFKKNFAEPYTQETGVKFDYVVNGIDPTIPVNLQEDAGKVKIDLIDSGQAAPLAVKDYLAPFPDDVKKALTDASLPGTVDDRWWTFGTVPNMIVCNPRLVQKCPTTPAEFFDTDNFPGDRMMTTDQQEMGVFTLLAAGVSRDQIATDPPIEKIEPLLSAIKPHVKLWAASGDQQQQAITNGEVGIAVMWESQLVRLVDNGMDYLKWSWNGAATENDQSIMVPKGAPNAALAFDFTKWIAAHPKNQAGFSTALGTFVPGKDVLQYIDPAQKEWQLSSHTDDIFFWPSVPWVKKDDQLQKLWRATVG